MKLDHCHRAGCVQIIEQLRTRIAEIEKENARLSEVVESNIDDGIDKIMAMSDEQVSALAGFEGSNPEDKATIARQCMDIAMLRVDLAASQAYAEQLRVALQTFIDEHEECTDADDWMAMLCSIEAHHAAEEALTLPHDTNALDAYVAEKVREAGKFDVWKTNPYTKVLETSIEQLTKQRDLAVEAMREALECGEDGDWQSARRILASAIKESEVK